MAIVELGLRDEDMLVLVNSEENRVLETFTVRTLNRIAELQVEDGLGRVFKNQAGGDLWVHPVVLIKLPKAGETKATARGYVTPCKVCVDPGYKIHFANFIKRNKPELFEQIPFKVRKEV